MLLRSLIVFSLALSLAAFGEPNKNDKNKHDSNKHHVKPVPPPEFEVIPLNSPVKESEAKFLLKVPSVTQIHKVYYRVTNVFRPMKPEMQDKETDLKKIANGYELDVPVNSLKPGFYRIFVHIVDKTKNDHRFLRHNNDYAKFAIDSSMEVPAPDPKINNATLEGVDSDGDGIRDDIQRWINANFATKPNTKLALKQVARAAQINMLSSDNKELSIQSTNVQLEANHCLYRTNEEKGYDIAKQIEALMTNTELRVKSELKNNANYHGEHTPDSISSLPIEREIELCGFESTPE